MNKLSSHIEDLALTVCIPAFNNPDYTRRTLDSLNSQTIKRLKVILIDDFSPCSLENIALDFIKKKASHIDFEYVRNERNFGINQIYRVYELVRTPLVLVLHHDDELIEPSFCADAVKTLSSDTSAVAYFGNAILEKSKRLMVRIDKNPVKKLSGPDGILYMLANGHTSWSSIVFRIDLAKKFGFPRAPYLVDKDIRERSGLDGDEGFSTFYLLATQGDFIFSQSVVSIRGEPETQYSKSGEWKNPGSTLFFIYYGIFRWGFQGISNSTIRWQALLSTLYYGLPRKEKDAWKKISYLIAPSIFMRGWFFLVSFLTRLKINYEAMILICYLVKGRILRFSFQFFFIIFKLILWLPFRAIIPISTKIKLRILVGRLTKSLSPL